MHVYILPHHTETMSNKTVLITGATKRIGAAITRKLHQAGMNVIIHFNSSGTDATSLSSELNELRTDSANTLQSDLRDTSTYRKLIDAAYAINNRLDVLINNASVFYPTPIETFTSDQWDELIDVNLKAPLFLSRCAARYLAESQGCIINLADIHAERPLKNHSIYSISKAGLVMLTKSLAKELGPAIRVNAISPGAIFWPDNMAEETRQEILSRTVLKQQGHAEDVSTAVCYLIEDARYTTGQVLIIDGGRTLFS